MQLNSAPINSGAINSAAETEAAGKVVSLDFSYAIDGAPPRDVSLDLSYKILSAPKEVALEMSYTLNAFDINDVSLELSYEIPQFQVDTVSLEMSYGIPTTLDVHDVSLDLSYNFNAPLEQEFCTPAKLVVDQEFCIPLVFPVTQEWCASARFNDVYDWCTPAGLMATTEAEFCTPYEIIETDPIEEFFCVPYEMPVDQAWCTPAGLLTITDQEWCTPAGLVETVEQEFCVQYELGPDVASASWCSVYSLIDEAAINITGAIKLFKDGVEICIVDGEVQTAEGDFGWQGKVTLQNIDDLTLFDFDDSVQLEIFGEVYEMVVDSKSRSRPAPAQSTQTLDLISVTARLRTPRAQPLTVEFNTPIDAKSAVEAILGQSVDWRIINWTIPAGRLAGDGVDPMELAQQVASAAGARIETKPDGSLYVRYLFPVPVGQWGTTVPDHVYLECDHILSTSQQFDNDILFNQFRIRDATEQATRDRIVFEADEGNGLAGCAFVYPTPFRAVTLDTTSDSNVSIAPQGEVIQSKEDCIEIKEGTGRLSFPINSIVSVEWLDDDLGTLNFTQGDTTVTNSNQTIKYGLARVVYTTKALKFRVTSNMPDKVQLLVEDC